MKLKKLLATILVAMMALSVIPITASAAGTPQETVSAYAPSGGVAVTSLSIAGKSVTFPATKIATGSYGGKLAYKQSITVPYKDVQSNFEIKWNIPTTATVTATTDSTNWVSTPQLGASNDSNYYALNAVAKKAGAKFNYVFKVENTSNPWTQIVSKYGGDGVTVENVGISVSEITYTVEIIIDSPTRNLVSMFAPTKDWGTFAVVDNTSSTPTNSASQTTWRAFPGDTITLTPPSVLNPANGSTGFKSFGFSQTVEIASGGTGTYISTPPASNVVVGGSYDRVYMTATGTLCVKMPDTGNLTIYVYDADGYLYGTKSSSSPSTPSTPSTPGTTTGDYRVSVSGGSSDYTYYNYGDRVYITATSATNFTGWSSSEGNIFANVNSTSTYFTMPARNVTVTANYDQQTYNVSANNGNYGYGSVNVSRADTGDSVRFSASVANYASYGYVAEFSYWSFNRAVTYVTGYGSTSSTTYVYMPSGDLVGTPVFTLRQTSLNQNTNTNTGTTFTDGVATASISTTTGTVTAGLNASRVLNSNSTARAINAAISRRLVGSSGVLVNVPQGATGISASAMSKLLSAAGSYGLTIQINSDYGTITVPVTSSRQILTGITGSNATIRSAISTFQRSFGNRDIIGVQTTQSGNFGATATYRFNINSLGLNVGYGDRVYVAIYNPSTKKFVRKTVSVGSNGTVAFTSAYAGVVLFSASPFTK